MTRISCSRAWRKPPRTGTNPDSCVSVSRCGWLCHRHGRESHDPLCTSVVLPAGLVMSWACLNMWVCLRGHGLAGQLSGLLETFYIVTSPNFNETKLTHLDAVQNKNTSLLCSLLLHAELAVHIMHCQNYRSILLEMGKETKHI